MAFLGFTERETVEEFTLRTLVGIAKTLKGKGKSEPVSHGDMAQYGLPFRGRPR